MGKPNKNLSNYTLELKNALGSLAGIGPTIADIVAAARVKNQVDAEKQAASEPGPTVAKPPKDKGKGVAAASAR